MKTPEDLSKFKAVIFDLDGTLVDTEEANFQAYKKACEQNGFSLDEKLFRSAFEQGHGWKNFILQSTKLAEDDPKIKKILDEKKKLYPDALKKYAVLNAELCALAKKLKASGKKLCLATTAAKENAESVLLLFGLNSLFDVVIDASQVKNRKPDPEIYLLALEKLGVNASEAIVFEDSPSGKQAAEGAALNVVTVNFIEKRI